MTSTVNRLASIAFGLGALLWVASDAKWFKTIADNVEEVPEQITLSGPARVIDGETVSVAGTWVRLVAVDVAELGTRWATWPSSG